MTLQREAARSLLQGDVAVEGLALRAVRAHRRVGAAGREHPVPRGRLRSCLEVQHHRVGLRRYLSIREKLMAEGAAEAAAAGQ